MYKITRKNNRRSKFQAVNWRVYLKLSKCICLITVCYNESGGVKVELGRVCSGVQSALTNIPGQECTEEQLDNHIQEGMLERRFQSRKTHLVYIDSFLVSWWNGG